MKFYKKQSRLIQKKNMVGLLYVLPFIIGFFTMILIPMIQSIIYSFNDLQFSGKVSFDFVGLDNYKRLFTVDTEFRELFLDSLTDMIVNVPIILIFSMLVAVFLNGNFHGQSVFQIIFFIPVILYSGFLPELFSSDRVRDTIINASSMVDGSSTMFNIDAMSNLLTQMNMNAKFIDYIMHAIVDLMDVISSSGIQILVFLIALKAIPKSLFEAANVEGATAWESFWKITFPMILPNLIVNIVYTIIDAFTNNNNPILKSIESYNFTKFQFGYAASLSWVYFAIIIVILVVFVGATKLLIKRNEQG